MATYTPYNAGDYQRRQNQIEYEYSNDAATNAYGRFLGQQHMTQEAQQYDLKQQQSDAFRQQSLMELEMEKARQIAEDAASLQALRSMYGGLG
jgi:hypothetical protein